MGRLDGKVAIVTGAGRGIGRGVALALGVEGAKVVVNDLGVDTDATNPSHESADRVVAAINAAGGTAVANYDDMAKASGGESVVKQALDTYGTLDILVTCAGIRQDKMFWEMTERDFNLVLDNTLKSTFTPTKYACIQMRQERKGRIVMMTADAALGDVGVTNYAAATDGVLGFSRTVARDMGRYGITCNAISPLVRTRLFPGDVAGQRRLQGVVTADDMAGLASRPFWFNWEGPDDPNHPDNVAPVVVYLCLDEAANINAQLFGVRGGSVYIFNYPTVSKSIHRYGGRFPIAELDQVMPQFVLVGLKNPAPPQ